MRFELLGVRQTFGDVNAIDGISTEIEGNKIIGLLGRNGSGKSTILSIMAGFRKPSDGAVLLDGEPVFENAIAARRIALIREGGDTVEESEKVSEALRYAAWYRPNWNVDIANRLLERFEVSPKSKLDQLSRGKRSAVGIALGLGAQAAVTMFDETYLGLDAPSRYLFYDELLSDYMANPRMFVLSTHLIDEVAKLLEEVVIIDKGQVLLQESSENIASFGTSVTGSAESVEQFIAGRQVIGGRQLGRTRSAMVYGSLTAEDRHNARSAGLELDAIDLQDLFVFLTTSRGGDA